MSRWLNLVQLYELSLQKEQEDTIPWETIRKKIIEKIHNIVENRWIDLIYYLWNKTVPFKNLDSELHQELSRKYPYDYLEALTTSWMSDIDWLSQFWSVLRNIIVYLENEVWESEYKNTLYELFLIIPDLTKIPIYDIWLFKKKLWNEKYEQAMNNRSIKVQNYIHESLQKYPF